MINEGFCCCCCLLVRIIGTLVGHDEKEETVTTINIIIIIIQLLIIRTRLNFNVGIRATLINGLVAANSRGGAVNVAVTARRPKPKRRRVGEGMFKVSAPIRLDQRV